MSVILEPVAVNVVDTAGTVVGMRGDGSYDRQVGRVIQTVAKYRGITIRKLAADLDFAYSSLMDRIHGRRHFSAEEIRDLAAYLQVSADQLLGFTVEFEFAWNRRTPALRVLQQLQPEQVAA